MYTFEKYMEMRQLCSIYKTKLDNWQNKRTSATVEVVEEGPSCYSEKQGKIKLSPSATQRTVYHEYGHEMWSNSDKQFGHQEVFRVFWVEDLDTLEDFLVWFDILMDEYQIRKKEAIIPITDIVGMWLDERIPGKYYSHPKGYAQKFHWSADIYANEFFADFCGLIGTNEIEGLILIEELFPSTFNKALDIIDEMMSKAITKKVE